jgi:hypothetical protein
MAATLLEKWNALFPNGAPDKHRTETSKTSDAITNPLSLVSGLDNKYTSTSPVPSGRKSQAISVLWENWCGVGGDSDASINHLTVGFGADERFAAKKAVYVEAMGKNVTVRAGDDGAGHGQKAFDSAKKGSKFDDFFAAIDNPVIALNATVKGNYRLGAVNPDGGFSNYTGRPMTNGGDDIATISLQQYRDGMG